MATLPAGMKQVRTQSSWGSPSVHYDYKGVKIRKYRDSWTFWAEVQIWETGKISIEDTYGDYRLAGVPQSVERYLQDENYVLDTEQGIFRLSEARKAELQTLARKRITDEIQAMENYLAQYLQEKNWRKLESTAARMNQFTTRHAWALELEGAVN
jgi:hypothetical protein